MIPDLLLFGGALTFIVVAWSIMMAQVSVTPDWFLYLCAATLFLGAWAILIEPVWIKVTRRTLELPQLPPELEGLRLGFISDTHCGAWSKRAFFDKAWKQLEREAADILLIGGDIVVNHASSSWLEELEGLSDYQPPLGKYAVLGGHDRHYGSIEVTRGLQSLGVNVLHNQSVPLQRQGVTWYVVGLGDNSDLPSQSNPRQAFADVPETAFAVTIAHSPDIVIHPEAKRFSLVLSGHTHAGQVRIPWLGAPLCVTELPRRHDRGFTHFQGIPLFVSQGLGCTVRLRFCCRPEICILTLKRQS